MLKNFLSPPSPAVLADMKRALRAIDRVFPVSGAHRRDLPYAVRDLSRLLTTERADIRQRSYWSAVRNVAAYLHYFLPWNLYRLAWLLPGLDLGISGAATIVDLGSGPLTLPLGLWLFKPELRDMPLSFICADTAVRPMELGRDILRELAGGNSAWKINLIRGQMHTALSGLRQKADLVMMANALNELPPEKGRPLEQKIFSLVKKARDAAGNGLLFIEPGARLGGKLISLARKAALALGCSVLSPCPHGGPCPLFEQRRYNPRGPEASGWCHFVFPSDRAPDQLAELSSRANLAKQSLAISAVHLSCDQARGFSAVPQAGSAAGEGALGDFWDDELADFFDENDEGVDDSSGEDGRAVSPYKPVIDGPIADLRVISKGIMLPGEENPARYVCSAKGLGLLQGGGQIPSGGSARAPWPEKERRDRKTGALLLTTKQ